MKRDVEIPMSWHTLVLPPNKMTGTMKPLVFFYLKKKILVQGGHGIGKTGNLGLTFSRQGKRREFCYCNAIILFRIFELSVPQYILT